ncbi:MAG: TatD family hydrolase [Patescibacteria group bacterium]|nr:TatD family hydrolase [Patescibacteria group bacterium]
MPKYIDTHAHLDADIYSRDIENVVKAALAEDTWIVTVGSDYNSSVRAVEIAERFPEGVYAAVGLHPLKVPGVELAEDKLVNLEMFNELAKHPKVVAIGETGLDYHDLPQVRRNSPEAVAVERLKANQKKALTKFLQLAAENRLPLLLHCRDAHDDLLEIIERWDKTSRGFDCRGIIHHFSGDWKQARRYFNLDLSISFTALLVNGGYQTEVLRKMPLSHLVLESECPHLTSIPWNLRRNEPSFMPSVAAAVAGVRRQKTAEIAAITTANALRILNRLRPQG